MEWVGEKEADAAQDAMTAAGCCCGKVREWSARLVFLAVPPTRRKEVIERLLESARLVMH